jgi:AraC family transcriptional regulator, transcriptional activator FtrA
VWPDSRDGGAESTGMTARKRHVVAAIIPRRVSLLELAVAVDVFGDWYAIESPLPWYEIRVCGEGDAEEYGGSFGIRPSHGLDAVADADTVIAMPFDADGGNDQVTPAVVDAVRAAYDRGARIVSFCTGTFVLADAGILDGRRAATHWRAAEQLKAEHPKVLVDAGVLYVDEGQVLTSAGAAASVDLALHIVRMDHGAEVANAVARRMVVPPHRDGGQAQYVEMPILDDDGEDPFRDTLEWAAEHLDEPLTVGELAARSLMSPRTFARRFRQVTGTSPHQWLLRQRVVTAQRLLETTEEPVERIAQHVGFGSAATLRMHFQRIVQTSPLAYRRTFTCCEEAEAS